MNTKKTILIVFVGIIFIILVIGGMKIFQKSKTIVAPQLSPQAQEEVPAAPQPEPAPEAATEVVPDPTLSNEIVPQ